MPGKIDLAPAWRRPLLALGIVALLFGVAGGLARLGIAPDLPLDAAAVYHGPLMVGGFFGTVIALERAVALGALWAYSAPLLSGAGGLLLAGGMHSGGVVLLLAGSLVFVAASLAVCRKQPAFFTGVLLAGACCWAAGNAFLLSGAWVAGALPWWIVFFVLTVAGERLELSRLLPLGRGARPAFAAIACLLVLGAALSAGLMAAALGAMALWLGINDAARRTAGSAGLPRYIALSLLGGYAWLLAGAALMAANGGLEAAGLLRDAALHALLVGFVFSMVFGHAPVIFPAVLGIRIAYTAWMYLPLALLHLSLALRVAGDLGAGAAAGRAGSAGNAAALLVFLITLGCSALASSRARRAA